MAKKPESRYIDKVHRQFDKYEGFRRIRMNMGLGSPNGIPDMLYQGNQDLWVEYKYVKDLTRIRKIPWDKLSAHQYGWIEKFLTLNSVNSIAVVIGDEQGNGLFLSEDILRTKNSVIHDPKKFVLHTPKDIAARIKGIINNVS